MLKLMCITNDINMVKIIEKTGVDRVMVDLEKNGKLERQRGWNSAISNHTIADVARVRRVCKKAKLLVRINSINKNSANEIEEVISYNPDVIMLPYFKKASEVEKFVSMVNGRAKVCVLIETKEAVENIDEILSVKGIDEAFIGLNDLSHSIGKDFLFECLCDGMVEKIVGKIKEHGIKDYGFGGIAHVGYKKVPAEMIIAEHYRLGSTCTILSRSFYSEVEGLDSYKDMEKYFKEQVALIRRVEKASCYLDDDMFKYNQKRLKTKIDNIIKNAKPKNKVNVLVAGNNFKLDDKERKSNKLVKISVDCQAWETDEVKNPEKYDYVICNNLFLYNDITKFKNLKVIQLLSSGISEKLRKYTEENNIALYNAKDVYSIPIAETIVMQILNISKNSKFFYKNQAIKKWEKDRQLLELNGKTAMVIGYGSIGRETAKRLSSLGVNVFAANRTKLSDEHISKCISMDEIIKNAGSADIVVVCVAGVEETRNLINKEFFDNMKNDSIFVNVSRGFVINEEALINAIKSDKFRGVALDVFESEPLGENSCLWDYENVYITPHNSFVGDGVTNRLYQLVISNFRKHFVEV